MKIIFTFISLLFVVASVMAQSSTEYLQKNEFRTELKKVNDGINGTKKSILETRKMAVREKQISDSLINLMSAYPSKLVVLNDSIKSISKSVSDIQSTIEIRQSTSRSKIIISLAVIFILLALSFILIILYKRKSDQKNEQLAKELNQLKSDLQTTIDSLKSSISTMKEIISSSTSMLEEGINQIDQQVKEAGTQIERISEKFGVDLNRFKEDYEIFRKLSDQRKDEILSTVSQKNTEITALFNRDISNIKTSLHNLTSVVDQLKEKK